MEAVAAVVVMAVAMPPMLWSLQQSHRHGADQVLASRARWLAVEKLEDVIADRHAEERGYEYVAAENYPAEAWVPGFAGFSRSVSVVETGVDLTAAGTGYKTVAVTVGYADGRGAARGLTISTVVTEYSP
jgi:hypothetical protein